MLLWRRAFERHLKEVMGGNLELVWTKNRRVMITFTHKKGAPVLRLHESFATADEKLKNDLVHYLSKPRAKIPKSVREFVNTISSEQEEDIEKINPRGENYDLLTIYRKLNKTYFDGKLKGNITWGRRFFAPRKRSIVFGSYMSGACLIRIHPVLDTELVPLFYLESVVHHEMVHEYLDTNEGAHDEGPRHSKVFRKLERGFQYYELAIAWEKSHLSKLLQYKPVIEK